MSRLAECVERVGAAWRSALDPRGRQDAERALRQAQQLAKEALAERDAQITRVQALSRENAEMARTHGDARIEYDLKLQEYATQIESFHRLLDQVRVEAERIAGAHAEEVCALRENLQASAVQRAEQASCIEELEGRLHAERACVSTLYQDVADLQKQKRRWRALAAATAVTLATLIGAIVL